MPNIFDQIEQAAAEQGATAVLDMAKEQAMKGAVGLGAMALGPENVEDIRQAGRDIDDRFGPDIRICLLYTSPSPRDVEESRMPSSA